MLADIFTLGMCASSVPQQNNKNDDDENVLFVSLNETRNLHDSDQ